MRHHLLLIPLLGQVVLRSKRATFSASQLTELEGVLLIRLHQISILIIEIKLLMNRKLGSLTFYVPPNQMIPAVSINIFKKKMHLYFVDCFVSY